MSQKLERTRGKLKKLTEFHISALCFNKTFEYSCKNKKLQVQTNEEVFARKAVIDHLKKKYSSKNVTTAKKRN